jgi:RNA polymerase-binding protein DksA
MAEKKPLKQKSGTVSSKAIPKASKPEPKSARSTSTPAKEPVKTSKVKSIPAAAAHKTKSQTPTSNKTVPSKKTKNTIVIKPEKKSNTLPVKPQVKSKGKPAPVVTVVKAAKAVPKKKTPVVTPEKPVRKVKASVQPPVKPPVKPVHAPAPQASPKKAVPGKKIPAVPAKPPVVPPVKPVEPVKAPKPKPAAGPAKDENGSDRKKKRKYTRRVAPAPAPVVAPKYQGRVATPSSRKPDAQMESRPTQKNVVQYPKEILEFFRSVILDKIKEANEELVSIEERLLDSSSGEFNDDDSTYSLHMADQGTDAMEREKAFLFAQRERKFISHLSDALQRISSGNFGICINCGDLIDKGRLEAVPHARMCVNCKNKSKQSE